MKIHVRTSKDNQRYFTVVARNGKVFLTSETYKSERNVMKAVNTFKKDIKDLPVVVHFI
jgi:uncharacterized protein YegP (UPF0339 family)